MCRRGGSVHDMPATKRAPAKAGTVSVRFVMWLIETGVDAGIPRNVLMDAAGVTPENLIDPDARVPLASELALWNTLSTRLSDPALGLRMGGALDLRQVGVFGYV